MFVGRKLKTKPWVAQLCQSKYYNVWEGLDGMYCIVYYIRHVLGKA